MLEAGQKDSALEYARVAEHLNPILPAVANRLIIEAAVTDLSKIDEKSNLYLALQELQQKFPGEEATLPLYVQLLAKTDQADEAKKVIASALASKPPPAASTLLRLAAVSRASNLGLEETCFLAAEKGAALTPEVALARATAMAESANSAAAAKYFQESMQKSGPADVSWRLAWAGFLEQIKDERAAATWIALADDPALKANLNVQRDALAAASVQKDSAFITRTIERIRVVAGDQSIGWKMAHARLMLRDPASAKDPGLIKSSPTSSLPRPTTPMPAHCSPWPMKNPAIFQAPSSK